MAQSIFYRLCTFAALIALLGLPCNATYAAPLFTDVAVSNSGTGNHLASSSSSRTVAVAADGTIYVTYRGSNGIRVARSLDRGQSFRASVRITTTDAAAEIAVDADGIVYVAWITGNQVYLSRSTNRGTSFSAPTSVGSSSGSTVHIASDAPFVYLLPNTGTKLLRNGNHGVGTFLTSTPFSSITTPYADVQVDPTSGVVFVLGDYTLSYVVSSDHGATFGSQITPGGSIYYSTTALSIGPKGRSLVVGGQDSTAYRINLEAGTSEAFDFENSSSGPHRALAADPCGDLVEGHINSGNGAYAVSNTLGQGFGASTSMPGNVSSLGLAINPSNGDIVVAYERAGEIFASVFSDELITCPVVATNSPLVVDEGGTTTLTSDNLRVVDPNRTTDQIVYTLAAPPMRGTLQVGGAPLGLDQTFTQADIDGDSVVYTHNGSENSSDGLAFTVADGADGVIGNTTFAIAVNPVNDPPQAVNDRLTTFQNRPVTSNVLANDSDAEGGSLSATLVNQPTAGTAVLNVDGTLTYTPQSGFTGTDILTYEARDNDGSIANASVTITVSTAADLAVAISTTPSLATSGVPLTYLLSITNHGPSDATNVVLTPRVTVAESVSTLQLSSDSCPSSATTCIIGTLPVGATAIVTVVAMPVTTGIAAISASVTSSTLDPNLGDNVAQGQTTVGSGSLWVYLPTVVR